jgi:uncharacterized protein YggE
MKNIPLVILFISIHLISFVKVNAQVEPLSLIELQEQCKPPVIEVFGTAIIKVVPDKMSWSVNVQVDMDDVKEAKYQHDKSVSEVLNVLEEEGIPSKDIQTNGVRIHKRLNPYSNEKKYGVTNNIWFTVSDIEKYDRLSEKLTEIDDVYINNITLESTKAIETREQARTDALIAAKDKAEKMAETLGISIGEPLLIQEQPTSYYYPSFSNVMTPTSGQLDYQTGSTFSEGTINIEAKVMVTFKLVSKY